MGASQTEICNAALVILGEPSIVSIDDPVKSARTLKSRWDMVRRAELSNGRWNFCTQRVNIPALTLTSTQQAQIFPFINSAQLPADCLRLILLCNQRQTLGLINYRSGVEKLWQVEKNGIVNIANGLAAPFPIVYAQDIVNAGAFDPCFAEALAAKLAWTCCQAITNSVQQRKFCMEEYKRAIKEARLANALTQTPEGIADDSWSLSRL